MNLVIVGGQTSTGKSTLAKRLAKDLGMATCLKDTYKETDFFPTLNGKTTIFEWLQSEKLSWQRVYETVESAQERGEDLIIEGNFTGAVKRRLHKVIQPGTNVIEIFCYGRGFSTYRRFRARNVSGERHPGHRDERWYWVPWLEALTSHIGWRWVHPLKLGRSLLKVDATDFSALDYDAIRTYVQTNLR